MEIQLPYGWVIQRTDQGGGYAAPPGSRHSYVADVLRARVFPSKEAAEKECCPGNEVAVRVR
jgi:hypothetical protein